MDAKDKILQELTKVIEKGKTMNSCDNAGFHGWKSEILSLLKSLNLDETVYYKTIDQCKHFSRMPLKQEDINTIISQLISLSSQLQEGVLYPVKTVPSLSDLENIFDKFACVARQLRTRHDNRETLTIKDEYDVQDLLHALLLLHFDDVRSEEWTPSYAGGCERMDFLLRDLKTVIEVKKTRKTMTAKQLGEELIIDIEKYKTHPDCKFIYCFVYDPDVYLGNPAAIKNDLEKAHNGFVKVFIRPNS